jgi:phosphotransferase system enzyme I (PtsI)
MPFAGALESERHTLDAVTTTPPQHVLVGVGVAPGIASGHVHVIDRQDRRHPRRRVDDTHVDDEVRRLEAAWGVAREALVHLRDRAGEHGAILDAHLLMLADPMLHDGARRQVIEERKCAEWAIKSTVHDIAERFDALGDAYFRERKSDVDFVGERLLDALLVDVQNPVDDIADGAVIVAHDLSPGDAIALSRRGVRAFVTEVGGATSHTAILARALDIPAVIACKGVLERAATGDPVVVDGARGEVVLQPEPVLVARFESLASQRRARAAELEGEATQPAETPDGVRVVLLANIEVPDEVGPALARGAEGVGLYRSEFLFLNRVEVPTADEHEAACTAILEALQGRPATLRTFDLGSDKMSSAIRAPREQNPALGLRGVRLGLARPAALRDQLRGMVRALSRHRSGQILLPMIGSVEEVSAVRALLFEETDALAAAGEPVRRDIPLGIMIELPSAVWIADALADVADFFSVGTNDLIQYMLAIDRGNEHVAHLYEPLHPAVLRALRHVVDAAHRRGRPVSLCGEMAAEPRLAPICLGLGFDALSMPTSSLRAVKHVLRRFRADDARDLLDRCIAAPSASMVHGLVDDALSKRGLGDA